jgi:hypothetical protein
MVATFKAVGANGRSPLQESVAFFFQLDMSFFVNVFYTHFIPIHEMFDTHDL